MRVKCEFSNFLQLDDAVTVDRLRKYIFLPDGQLNLEKGKEYVVYGIIFRENAPWYYLCLDDEDESPTPYPAELFQVTDGRLSTYWRLSSGRAGDKVASLLVFDEWSRDPSFYERLLEGEPNASVTFRKYRDLMDAE